MKATKTASNNKLRFVLDIKPLGNQYTITGKVIHCDTENELPTKIKKIYGQTALYSLHK